MRIVTMLGLLATLATTGLVVRADTDCCKKEESKCCKPGAACCEKK